MTDLQERIETLQIDNAFLSLTQGFGMLGSDRTLDFVPSINRVPRQQEQYDGLFEANNYAANIVEYLPDAMGQAHPKYTCDNADVAAWIQKQIDKAMPYFVRAEKIARQTGGAGIFIGAADGQQDISEPLNESTLAKIEFLSVVEGGVYGMLQVDSIEKNPQAKGYGEPLFYRFKNTSQLIHRSRILPFYGAKLLTREQQKRYKYWGMSILERPLTYLRTLEIADQAIANTISQFSRLIVEIPNLDLLLETPDGRAKLKKYQQLINQAWNVLKMLPLAGPKDGTPASKVYNLKTDYSGLEPILRHFKEQLAGSADIPYGMLFNSGSKSGGLGTSSSSGSTSSDRTEERKWAEYVHRSQETEWRPNLEYLIRLWHLSMMGVSDRRLPESETLEFPSILQLSEGEKRTLDKTRADEYKTLVDAQIVTSVEAAKAIQKGTDIAAAIDIEAREQQPARLMPTVGGGAIALPVTPAQQLLAPAQQDSLEVDYNPSQPRDRRGRFSGYPGGAAGFAAGASADTKSSLRSSLRDIAQDPKAKNDIVSNLRSQWSTTRNQIGEASTQAERRSLISRARSYKEAADIIEGLSPADLARFTSEARRDRLRRGTLEARSAYLRREGDRIRRGKRELMANGMSRETANQIFKEQERQLQRQMSAASIRRPSGSRFSFDEADDWLEVDFNPSQPRDRRGRFSGHAGGGGGPGIIGKAREAVRQHLGTAEGRQKLLELGERQAIKFAVGAGVGAVTGNPIVGAVAGSAASRVIQNRIARFSGRDRASAEAIVEGGQKLSDLSNRLGLRNLSALRSPEGRQVLKDASEALLGSTAKLAAETLLDHPLVGLASSQIAVRGTTALTNVARRRITRDMDDTKIEQVVASLDIIDKFISDSIKKHFGLDVVEFGEYDFADGVFAGQVKIGGIAEMVDFECGKDSITLNQSNVQADAIAPLEVIGEPLADSEFDDFAEIDFEDVLATLEEVLGGGDRQ